MASSKKWRKKGKRNTKFKKKREGRPLMPNKDKDTKKQMMKWKFNSTTTNAQKFIIFASFQFVKFFFYKKLALLVPVYWKHNIFHWIFLWFVLFWRIKTSHDLLLKFTNYDYILQPGRVVRDWLCMRTKFTVSWVWVTSLA